MAEQLSIREQMRPYWNRFKWNLRHLFTNDINPYVSKGENGLKPKLRYAREDIFHALKNLPVELGKLLWVRVKERFHG